MHGLRLTDSRRAEQVFHGGLGRHHVHIGIAVPRDKVHMRELESWREDQLWAQGISPCCHHAERAGLNWEVLPAAPGYELPGRPF